jgi:hypothetical protein
MPKKTSKKETIEEMTEAIDTPTNEKSSGQKQAAK